GQALAEPARRGVRRDGGAARRRRARRFEAAVAAFAAAGAGRYSRSIATYAISGGAGFLGVHLSRRLVADGHAVRSLDVVPIDEPVEAAVTAIRGDMRDPRRARELCDGADVLVHAAAALPIRGSRREIRSVNVDGTAALLEAAREAGVNRIVYMSSTAVY